MLELKNIDKTFLAGTPDENVLFDGFELKIKDGEFVSIIGSNGSGKTTLLNMICGNVSPDRGDILIDGKSILHKKVFRRYESIGRVYQNPLAGSCADMTILENMSLAANKGGSFGLSRGTDKRMISHYREMLEELGIGLEDKLHASVGTLSGGQRQALALLMSTMTDIKFLILDEHTAALDPKTAEIIMKLTDKIVREKKLTVLMVTHNLRYAVEYGSRLIMLHEGRIVLDRAGEEKAQTQVQDVLSLFNEISIESGN